MRKQSLLVLVSVFLASIACAGASVAPTEAPGQALPPIPTDPPLSDTPMVETQMTAALLTESPVPQHTSDAPLFASPTAETGGEPESGDTVLVTRDDWGFALYVKPDWTVDDRTNGVIFRHPTDPRIWIGVFKDTYRYGPGIVDESVSQFFLDELKVVDPAAVFYKPYRHALGFIQNGRASDYIYVNQGTTIFGSVTVGTTLKNLTWIVQWEAPAESYPEQVEDFVTALQSITISEE
jgi:hypothetical protein